MRLGAETEDIYKALVAELAYSISPTTVMGLTLIVIGTFAHVSLQGTELLIATICGGLASLAKVIVMIRHRRFNATSRSTREHARRWEMVHGLLTWLVAASVGSIAAAIFTYPDLSLQILATALLFGYCAGVASRISVRPVISATAISIAAIPTTFSALAAGDTTHRILAGMFAIFLVAAMQSVWHVYQTALRQIRMRIAMERQARRDPLTDLANRIALREAFSDIPRLEHILVSIHCFDFDGFKAVNDRLGHSAGDELLKEVGNRLRQALDHTDCAARIGGDEFAVLQTNVRHAVEADLLARKICLALTEPYQIGQEKVTVGVSLGYTIAPAETADLEAMIRLADDASYRAKRKGGGIDRQVASRYERDLLSFAA